MGSDLETAVPFYVVTDEGQQIVVARDENQVLSSSEHPILFAANLEEMRGVVAQMESAA